MRRFAVFLVLILAAVVAGAWFFAKTPTPPPLPKDQAEDEIIRLAVGELVKAYPQGAPLVRRDAHAKAHGCVKAVFQVDPALPEDYRIGTFAEPNKRFKAWIRFSNGQLHPAPDQNPDGRGMSVKLIDADPDRPDSSGRTRRTTS